MKVLHVIPSVAAVRGGPTQVVLNLTRGLRAAGIETEIVTTNDNGPTVLDVPLNQRVEYEGVPVWFFPRYAPPNPSLSFSVGTDKAFLFSADLTRWLWHHIRDYDILDNHFLFSYAPTCAGAIARWQKVPYTVRTMGQLTPWALAQSQHKKRLYSLLIERQNLNRAAAIHCTTDGEAEDVRSFGIRTPTLTLPLGVDPPTLIPNAQVTLRDRYGIPQETPIILFLSRIHPKKRPDVLLQTLHRVMTQNQPFHCIVAGSGEPEYLRELTRLTHSLGLSDHVSFPGFVSGETKNLLLQGADLFVLPSFSENFGIAIAEAMVVGLPVMITPGIQIAPEIAAAKAGWVVEGDTEPLANAILQLLVDPALRATLGETGKAFAKQRYDWTAIAQNLAQAYQNIIRSS